MTTTSRLQFHDSGIYIYASGDGVLNLVADGEIDAVIFLRDPLQAHAHDVDILMLLRLCDVSGVPLATNYKSAHIITKYLMDKLESKTRYQDGNDLDLL